MKRNVVLIASLVFLVAVFAGCGSSRTAAFAAPASVPPGPQDVKPTIPRQPLLILSAAVGSPSAQLVTLYQDTWNQHIPGLRVSNEPGNMAQNMQNIHTEYAEMGTVSTLIAYPGLYGLDWADGTKYDRVAGMLPMFRFEMVFVTKASRNDINSLSDLNGKALAIGVIGSGADTTGRQLVDFFNINTSQLINGSWTDIGVQFSDNLVDAVFYVGANPVSFLQEIELTTELKYFELTDSEFDRFIGKYPYYSAGYLPANTYAHQTTDYKGLTGWNTVVCSPDLDDDLVYLLVRTIFDNLGPIHTAHPDFSHVSLESVKYLIAPALHPGAERYYRDVGAELPVPAAPPN